jgi:hypothetical protein
VAIHVGQEIRKRLKESGLPVTKLAKVIGCSAKTVHAIFKRPSIDTMLLKKCSEVLGFDFFALYSEDLRIKASKRTGPYVVAEPQAKYGLREPGVDLEIVIRPGQNKEMFDRLLRAIEYKPSE